MGQYLSASSIAMPLNHFAMGAAFFVCGFGNIVNDIVDIKPDNINHPTRALPSGIITIGAAKALAGLFLIVSCILSMFLNWQSIIIVDLALILLTVYNLKLKHTPYCGNLIVALLGGLTFILGGLTIGSKGLLELPGAIIPAVFAFLMHLGREILKDIQDCEGDKSVGSKTAPVRSGRITPLLISYAIFVIMAILSWSAYSRGWYGTSFLYISASFIYVPLALQFIWLGLRPEPRKCAIVATLIKIEMLPGIAALVIGKSY